MFTFHPILLIVVGGLGRGAVGCIQTLNSSYGTFSSPNYPGNYPNNVQCKWTIQPEGFQDGSNSVEITFSVLDLEPRYDFVQIFTDESMNVPLSDKLTEHQDLRYFIQSSPFIVVMSTDDSVTFSGFNGSYKIVPALGICPDGYGTYAGGLSCVPCAFGFYRNSSASPSGQCQSCPFGYTTNTTGSAACNIGCVHTLNSSYGTFSSPNYPNNYPDNAQCKWTIQPDGFQNGSNSIQLTFVLYVESYCDEQGCAFLQIFTDESMNVSLTDELTGDLEGLVYIQSSPFIVVMSRKVTYIGFNASYQIVPYQGICPDGYEIYDQMAVGLPCLPCAVGFYRNSSVSPSGQCQSCPFGYTTNTTGSAACNIGCIQTLNSSYDTFSSPNYPSDYPDNVQCKWIIQPDGFQNGSNSIEITFSVLDLDPCCDFVQIFTDESMNVPLSDKLTGYQLNLTYDIQTSPFVIVMSTDDSVTLSGFNASYQIVQYPDPKHDKNSSSPSTSASKLLLYTLPAILETIRVFYSV